MVYSFQNSATYAILPTYYHRKHYQPSKNIVLLSVALSVLLLLSQIFSSFNIRKPLKLSLHAIYKSSAVLIEDLEVPSCLKNFLGSEKPPAKPPDTCHHIIPSRDICTLYEELFHHNSPKTCRHIKAVIFCNMRGGHINCTIPEECGKKMIYTGVFDHASGDTVWEEVHIDLLEKKIYSLAQKNHYKGYIFIKCSSDGAFRDIVDDMEEEEGSNEDNEGSLDHTQLFIYPKISSTILEGDLKRTRFPNINMVMIDSLSRNHFFRSLPQTIHFLENLKKGSTHTVVDFPYFQALKQRTFESLQALFAGHVDMFRKPFGLQSMPYFPLSVEVLFEKFKNRGYHTLWLEDLCWKWEWGLVKDLKVFNKSLSSKKLWKNYKKSLKKAMIDEVGVSLSSCEILKASKVKDPFHGAPAVCFNGKYHHDYIFEYLQLYQEMHQQADRKSLFTLTISDVSHEETGVRVQSIDPSLKKYLEGAQSLHNTITILFSDHGNSYGTYLERSSEAYVETFNPFLIFIIPKTVVKAIGKEQVAMMKENSQHLVSLLDLHETLLALIGESNDKREIDFKRKYVIPKGLLGNIPPKRTCNDLPLLMPNICICRDFDISVEISDFHYAYAEFSLGVINNLILMERHKIGQTGFGGCQMLRLKTVRSAKELRKMAHLTQFKLDVEVTGILSSVVELFFFTVEVGFGEPSIRLISFERNSPYGEYQSCQDKNVDLRMCACELGTKKTKLGFWSFFIPGYFSAIFDGESSRERKEAQKQVEAFFVDPSPYSKSHIDRKYPEDNPCLFILRHKYQNSFNIFGLNICSTFHKVTLEVVSENVFLSDNFVSSHILYPLDVKHLIGGFQANLKQNWFWDCSFVID